MGPSLDLRMPCLCNFVMIFCNDGNLEDIHLKVYITNESPLQ
jgi:hypothetical protein